MADVSEEAELSRVIEAHRHFANQAKQDKLLMKEEIRRITNASADLKARIDGARGGIEPVVMESEQVLAKNAALRDERQAL